MSSRRTENDRDSQRLSKRGAGKGKPGGLSPQVILGIAACVVVVLAAVFFAVGGDSKKQKRRSSGDNLPASAYVQRAQKLRREGDPLGAAAEYDKAALAAEQAGSEAEASSYAMQAYGLRKHTPLNLGH